MAKFTLAPQQFFTVAVFAAGGYPAAGMETPRDTPREVMESARESRRAPLHEKVKANKALEQMKALPS